MIREPPRSTRTDTLSLHDALPIWRDGIGPREKRPVRINYTWGGVTYDNSFGTNEFMNYTEKLGADAYIAGNMGSMPPRDMQQWIEYMTADGKSDRQSTRLNSSQ